MSEDWIILNKTNTREREILSITLQAAGFNMRRRLNTPKFISNVHEEGNKYVSFSVYWGITSTNTHYHSVKVVTYDDVMRKLRNIIENNSKRTWTLQKDGE